MIVFIFNVPAMAKNSVTRKPTEVLSDSTVKKLFDKLDNACAGNDNGGVYQYDVKKFKPGVAKKDLRKMNNGCRGMKVSKNKQQAVEALTSYLTKSSDAFSSCVKDNLSAVETEQVLSVVSDPQNLAVFSSQFDNKDDSEACSFHHFSIYRLTGQKIYIVHDETD